MKKIKKGIIFFGILIAILFTFLIGITTDFLTDKIEDSKITKCKEFVGIIEKNREFILNPTEENFISNSTDIDKVIPTIGTSDKDRLIKLIESKFCEYVEINGRNDCVIFRMKTSINDWSIVGRYKILFIIYEKRPNCNCKDNPEMAPRTIEYVKKLSKNWYETKVEKSLRYFGC